MPVIDQSSVYLCQFSCTWSLLLHERQTTDTINNWEKHAVSVCGNDKVDCAFFVVAQIDIDVLYRALPVGPIIIWYP